MTEQLDFESLSPQTPPADPEAEARRAEYRRRLAEHLKDPAFRAIEGFPIGTDEDILALSDPPYYTACPNPFLPEIIAQWQQEREAIRQRLGLTAEPYRRDPFAADVSEGKNDPIYNAHSYHTKVPHKAIMRYILHYTDPGDIVFDGFCGTGMTGVAAQLCGDKKAVEELGYRVDEDGVIWDGDKAFSRLGARKAVLNDLSPAATFIAYNYNTPVDAAAFEREARRILRSVEQECGWMYETWHPNCDDPNRVKGKINYTVWSDVFACPNCGQEMVFWDVAMDHESSEIRDSWTCPGCAVLLAKSPKKGSGALKIEHIWETNIDREINQTVRQAKQVPVLVNYSVGNKRFKKRPDAEDLGLIIRIKNTEIPYNIPTNRIPPGDKTSDPFKLGITHVHHFYFRRNILSLSTFIGIVDNAQNQEYANALKWGVTGVTEGGSKMNRERMSGLPSKLSGTLYVGSTVREINILAFIERKLLKLFKNQMKPSINKTNLISTHSSSHSYKTESFCDYLFVDPPFGSNLMYSELNYLWEAWLQVFTNNKPEAIMNNEQRKKLVDYQQIMQDCFNQFYLILKLGRWMTIEFHNSQSAVWNAIQEALMRAGFVIADVRTLDKQQLGFNGIRAAGAVKQDLIISAYKPNGNLEERFKLSAGTEDGAWEFVRYHLGKLPVINQSNGQAAVNTERQAFLLFDRMVAFHIQRGVMVPLSAPEFYAGLEQRFIRRDSMYFLPEQVTEYDRARLNSDHPIQPSLFVSDEKSAIAWLRQQLDPAAGGQPKTQGDLSNDFNRAMTKAKHEKALELIEILRENFLQDENTGQWYVPDPNKASDLDKIRQRALLREFSSYVNSTGRLRLFRTEAVRAGFADCFKRKDYNTIIQVAERLPEDVLREDPDLLMYYDSALLRKE